MPISIHCDCGKTTRVRDDLARKKVRCPACKAVLTVPHSNAEDEVPTLQEQASQEPRSRLDEVRAEWRKNQPTYERDPAERYHVDDGDPEPPRRRERDPEQAPERSRSRRSQREDDDDGYRMEEEERRPAPPRKRRKAWKMSTRESETEFVMPWELLIGLVAISYYICLIAGSYWLHQNGFVLTPRGFAVAGLLYFLPAVYLMKAWTGEWDD
jgi:hypothetical protein